MVLRFGVRGGASGGVIRCFNGLRGRLLRKGLD